MWICKLWFRYERCANVPDYSTNTHFKLHMNKYYGIVNINYNHAIIFFAVFKDAVNSVSLGVDNGLRKKRDTVLSVKPFNVTLEDDLGQNQRAFQKAVTVDFVVLTAAKHSQQTTNQSLNTNSSLTENF